MEPTNEELRIAFDELKSKMGLIGEAANPPILSNKEYSRKELLGMLEFAHKLAFPEDKFTKKTTEILKYVSKQSI